MEAHIKKELDSILMMVKSWKEDYLRIAKADPGNNDFLISDFRQEIEEHSFPYLRRLLECNYITKEELSEFYDFCYKRVEELQTDLDNMEKEIDAKGTQLCIGTGKIDSIICSPPRLEEEGMIRTPDFIGLFGKMWKVAPPSVLRKSDHAATLGTWVLTIPSAHPWWHSYWLSVVHLRDIPGVPPANKQYPEATHEIILFALNPEKPLPDPDDGDNFRPAFLTPANLVEHIHGVTDEQAASITEKLGRAFVDGYASPDTDCRSHTQQLLRNTVEHFTIGH